MLVSRSSGGAPTRLGRNILGIYQLLIGRWRLLRGGRVVVIIWGQIGLAVTGVWVGLQHSERWILQQGGAGGLPGPGVRPRLLLLMMAAFRRRVLARPRPLVTVLIRSVIRIWKISIRSRGQSRGLRDGSLLWRRLFVFVTQTALPHHARGSSVVHQAGARLGGARKLSSALDHSEDVGLDFMGLLIIFRVEADIPDIPRNIGDGGVFLWFQFCLVRPLGGWEGMRDTREVI